MIEEYKKFKILFLDDEPSITKLALTVFGNDFEVLVANTVETAYEFLNQEQIAIVASDYNMPDVDGIEFLTTVKELAPDSKRVLITGKLDLDLAKQSVNQVHIDLIVEKPWNYNQLKADLSSLMDKYLQHHTRSKQIQELEHSAEELEQRRTIHTNDLLDVLSTLKETQKISEFAAHFLTALQGLQSLALVNVEFYLESDDKFILDHAFQYISDMEVIATQYDQKALNLYVYVLRCYIYAASGDFVESKKNYLAARALYDWIKGDYIAKPLIEAIKQFPYKSDVDDLEATNVENPMGPQILEFHVKALLSTQIGDLINITESIFDLVTDVRPAITYFVVIRNDIPIYDKQAKDQDIEASLISGFVVALSQFLQETISGSGEIDRISHNRGVILLQNHEGIIYVLFLTTDDVRYRIALREFASKAGPLLDLVPENHLVSDEERSKLDLMTVQFLGEF